MAITLQEQDLYRIAVGVLYLTLDRALTSFPGTTRAHPSLKAVVYRSTREPLRKQDNLHFPFSVNWKLWNDVVVPVIQDDRIRVITRNTPGLRNPINAHLVDDQDYEGLLAKIVEALIDKAVSLDWLPAGSSASSLVPNPPPINAPAGTSPNPKTTDKASVTTAPVLIPDLGGYSPVGGVTHPQGHLQLTFKVIT